MKTVNHQSTTVHYQILGKGKPLVFLHGFLENSTMWHEFVEPLAKTNQIILIDLPCHGKTRFEGELCSMTFMAETVNAVLKEENIENPTIFGHSMGGYVGLELAKLTDVKLVMIHSNFWDDSIQQKSDRDRVVDLVQDRKPFFCKVAIPNLFYPNNRKACEGIINDLIDQAIEIPTAEICAATLGLKTRVANHEVVKNQGVIIIQGEFDTIMTLEEMNAQIETHFPTQTMHLIKACGHMSIWEKTDKLLAIVKKIVS
jgi:pimeloyl-ACP methyl ester carboxylesterase